jgi:hypothetical protein
VNNFYEKAIYMSESDLCNLCALKRAGLEVSRGPAELEIVDNQEHAIRHWEVFERCQVCASEGDAPVRGRSSTLPLGDSS